jgi:hypothetical protein
MPKKKPAFTGAPMSLNASVEMLETLVALDPTGHDDPRIPQL